MRLSGLCRYKQRGKAAEEADNVFHHLTYEGAVDVENMADKQQRAALESQINEFGQCPRLVTPGWERVGCRSWKGGGGVGRGMFTSVLVAVTVASADHTLQQPAAADKS